MAGFAEYTRLRDIAQKRQKRLSAAGLSPAVHIPTVREIRAGLVDPKTAMRELKDYLSGGSTVKAARQTGMVPEFKKFPTLPDRKALSPEEKRERKREQNQRYRQRKRLREQEYTPGQLKRFDAYLKALDTVSKTWRRAGVDIGFNTKTLTPSQAQAFVEYMEFRFSQGDFKQRYVIDEFIQDFQKLMNRGYNTADAIKSDFNQFLEDRKALDNRAENMEGISPGEMMGLFSRFVDR